MKEQEQEQKIEDLIAFIEGLNDNGMARLIWLAFEQDQRQMKGKARAKGC